MSSNRVKDWRPKREDWGEFIDVIVWVGPSPVISQWEVERALKKLCSSGEVQDQPRSYHSIIRPCAVDAA